MAWFKKTKNPVDTTDPSEANTTETLSSKPTEAPSHGPYDISQKQPAETYLDFETLKIPMIPGMQVQTVLTEDRSAIERLNLFFNQTVVQLLVVAAPKSGGVTKELLDQTEESFKAQGAQTARTTGRWAEELQAVVPLASETGQSGYTPLRITFIEGPRWVLRVDMVGSAAVEEAVFNQAAALVDEIIVSRDSVPRAPLSLIHLQLPNNASFNQ